VLGGTDNPIGIGNFGTVVAASVKAHTGLSTYQTLRAFTVEPATVMGVSNQLGTIQPGIVADMDIIKGDPLRDVETIANDAYVMQNGRLFTEDDLLGLYANVPLNTPAGLALVDIRMPPSHSTEGSMPRSRSVVELPSTAIMVLSAHVGVEQATELLAIGRRTGYLLKGRVRNVEEFLEALERVTRDGSVIHPALVQELVNMRRRNDPLSELSSREREVLSLMAEGRSNAGIARRLWVAEDTVEKHVRSILNKLPIPAAEDDHRRVLAVVTFLESR
jgi:DNA-binding NarL/FixJ family response regulator